MKTINNLFIFIFLTIGIVSCTDKKDELKQQYIEACADGDFDKARAAVQKLEAIDRYTAEEGMKYVNDKEIYALLAKPSRDNEARIMYLYNSYEPSQLPYMADVVEVAISTGSDNLATKLLKSGVQPTLVIAKAAVAADNEELLTMIVSTKPDFLTEPVILEFYKGAVGEAALSQFILKNASQFTGSKLLALGIESKNIEIVEKALALDPSVINDDKIIESAQNHPELKSKISESLKTRIYNIRQSKPVVHSEGLVAFYEGLYYCEGGVTAEDKAKMKMPSENAAINRYNSQLMQVYSTAMKMDDRNVAFLAASAMMPTIEAYSGSTTATQEKTKGYYVDGNHYLIYHNYDEVNRLKAECK